MNPLVSTIGDLAVARTIALIALDQHQRLPFPDNMSFNNPCVAACSGILGGTRRAFHDAIKAIPRNQRDDAARHLRACRAMARDIAVIVGAKRGGVR